jgi:hypothetical protein
MKKILNITFVALLALCMASCAEDTNKQATGGTPVVQYVRALSATLPDNLVESEYLGARLAIIGTGLAGVNKVMFNDVQAILNPAYVTENSIIVSIPTAIPGIKEDKIRLYTSEALCEYAFEVKVPAPAVAAMDCEWKAEGETATITGQYFVNDDATPLTVTFTGGVAAEIKSSTVNSITLTVPNGAQEGPVTVTSVYGASKSAFWYKDSRNIILNFNADDYPDYGYYFGWHGGTGISDENGINGTYLTFGGSMDDETWDDGKFGFEVWTYLPTDPDFFDASKPDNYALKFEVRVPDAWSAAALQVIFTGADDVMLNWQNGNGLTFNSKWGAANGYLADDTWPRGLWNPWASTGTYQNSEWATVTIPMSDFKYNKNGAAVTPNGAGHFSGITLFVNGGGVKGTPCTPTIHIDNVRIVPVK